MRDRLAGIAGRSSILHSCPDFPATYRKQRIIYPQIRRVFEAALFLAAKNIFERIPGIPRILWMRQKIPALFISLLLAIYLVNAINKALPGPSHSAPNASAAR
jgi:hypothetical protein